MSVKIKVEEPVLKHTVNYLTTLLRVSKAPSVGFLRLAIDVCKVCGYVKEEINVEDEKFVKCMEMVRKVLNVLKVMNIVELVEPGVVNVTDSSKLLEFKKKIDELGKKVGEYTTKTPQTTTTQTKAVTSEVKDVKEQTQVQGLVKKVTLRKKEEAKERGKKVKTSGGDITKFF